MCAFNDDRSRAIAVLPSTALERHAAAEVDGASDGEVVQLQHLRDGWDSLLEVRNLLEIATKLDQGGITEASGAHLKLTVLQCVKIGLDEHQVGASLDGQESSAGNVDTVGVVEVADGSTDSSLKLNNGDVGLALLVTGDGLAVGDNLHLELIILHHTLDGLEVEPDVVGVEVLELLDRLELVDMLLGDLGNFEQTDRALVIDDGTTLDIGLGLVGQLHDVLGVGLHHVLGVPLVDGGIIILGDGQERVLVDSGVSGLVEGKDVDVVALVLLDDGSSVVICVERVHKDEGNVNVVCAVEVFNLSHGKVEEGHAITDLNDGLGTNTTHGGSQTTVELENSQLAKELDRLGVGKILSKGGIHGVALSLVVEVSSEQGEEVIHLGLEQLQIWLALAGLANPGVSIGDLPSSAQGP
ncbi:hypothetical protein HG530_004858 [Fusarium avenaceum]|nr:hypothetical protein HG530_004858 [Fusarium avenaceum]